MCAYTYDKFGRAPGRIVYELLVTLRHCVLQGWRSWRQASFWGSIRRRPTITWSARRCSPPSISPRRSTAFKIANCVPWCRQAAISVCIAIKVIHYRLPALWRPDQTPRRYNNPGVSARPGIRRIRAANALGRKQGFQTSDIHRRQYPSSRIALRWRFKATRLWHQSPSRKMTDCRRYHDRARCDRNFAGDQTGAGMVGEVRPEPFERDDHSITHS